MSPLVGLLLGSTAAAQEPPLQFDAPVGSPHAALRVVPRGDGAALLALGPDGSRVVGGEALPPALDAAATDLDGDGLDELVLCGPAGLLVLPWAGGGPPAALSTDPCRAIAVVDGTPRTLVVASDSLSTWTLPGPIDRGPLPDPPPADPLLAADRDRLWLADRGTADLRWIDARGRTRVDPGGPIDALAPELWLVDGRPRGEDREPVSFGGATAIGRADLAGDGRQTHVVLHPDAALVGLVDPGADERSWPIPLAARVLAVGDLDRDGRDELVLGDGQTLVIARSTVDRRPQPAPPAPSPTPEALNLHGTRLLGLQVPPFAGTGGTLASGRRPSTLRLGGGVGVAMGSSLGPGRGIGGSVALAVAMEHGAGPATGWIGVDSSPLFLQAGDAVVWHLLYLSGGALFGGPQARTGPYLSAGLVGAGVGWRVLLQPFEHASGRTSGLEARLALLAGPPAAEGPIEWAAPTGAVTLLYGSSLQLGRTRGRFDPAVPASVEAGAPREGFGTCRRLALSVGLTGGLSSTRLSWDLIGTGRAVEASFSPSGAIACETGGPRASAVGGLETAPFFQYRIPWDDARSDQEAHQMGSATIGAAFGGDAVRVGPIVTAGFWILGGGLRAAITPWRGPGGLHHGIELRALALVPSAPSGQAQLMYTAWLDPRRGARGDER